MSCQRKHSGGMQFLKSWCRMQPWCMCQDSEDRRWLPCPLSSFVSLTMTSLFLQGWAGGVAISAKKPPCKEFSLKHQCPGRSKQPYKCTEIIDVLLMDRNGSFKQKRSCEAREAHCLHIAGKLCYHHGILCREPKNLQPALLLPLNTSVHFDIKCYQNLLMEMMRRRLSSPAELLCAGNTRWGVTQLN